MLVLKNLQIVYYNPFFVKKTTMRYTVHLLIIALGFSSVSQAQNISQKQNINVFDLNDVPNDEFFGIHLPKSRSEIFVKKINEGANTEEQRRAIEEVVENFTEKGEYRKAEVFLVSLLRSPIAQNFAPSLHRHLLLLHAQVLSLQVKTEAAMQIINSIELSSVNDSLFLGDVYRTKGALYRDLGNFEESVQNYQSAIELYKRE